MAAARSELSGAEQQLMQAQSSLAALRSQLNSTPATIPGFGGGAVGGAAGQIAALESRLAQASASGWTDAHPDVVALRAQIARLRPIAAKEGPAAGSGGMPNPSYVSIREGRPGPGRRRPESAAPGRSRPALGEAGERARHRRRAGQAQPRL
jgi:hypothetical protein